MILEFNYRRSLYFNNLKEVESKSFKFIDFEIKTRQKLHQYLKNIISNDEEISYAAAPFFDRHNSKNPCYYSIDIFNKNKPEMFSSYDLKVSDYIYISIKKNLIMIYKIKYNKIVIINSGKLIL